MVVTKSEVRRRKVVVPKFDIGKIKITADNVDEVLRNVMRPPMEVVPGEDPKFLIVDLFCGAGGTTTGFELAKRFGKNVAKVIACVNHDPNAIISHWENHPEVFHFEEDIRTLDLGPLEKIVGRYKCLYPEARVVLWASLECFIEGTMILTRRGPVDIKDVKLGDEVLTHKNRWRKVTSLMSKLAPTVLISGKGFADIETTGEHPFYTKEVLQKWNNGRRSYDRYLSSDANWVEAKNSVGKMASSPERFDALPIPEIGGRGFEFTDDFWWVVGRWLGDGSVSKRGNNQQITISCGAHKLPELESRLKKFEPSSKRAGRSEIRFYKRRVRTAFNFDGFHDGLSEWLLAHFSKLAHSKTIPGWLLGMKREWREAVLEGYLSADGCESGNTVQCVTVSKKLAIGIKLLAQSLGYSANLTKHNARVNPIEGRIVKCRDQFCITWRKECERRQRFSDGEHSYGKIISCKHTGALKLVYNISVEEDESYVADGVVVHNCTNFSKAKGGQPRDADSRTLADHLPRYITAINPDYVQIENVVEFMSWGPLDENGKPVSRKSGEDWLRWRCEICGMGYVDEWRELNSADFGAYTSRNRLFGCFAKPEMPIAWPQPTHSKKGGVHGGLFAGPMKWKPVKEVLDFEDEGESIFNRKKDLSPKTLARIYAGLLKYVAGGADAFVQKHFSGRPAGKVTSVSEPAGTITTSANQSVVQATFMLKYNSVDKNGNHIPPSVEDPAPVVTTQNRLGLAFITKYYSSGVNVTGIEDPAGALTCTDRMAKVQPCFISKDYTGYANNQSIDAPAGTVMPNDKHRLVQCVPFVMNTSFGNVGRSIEEPAPPLLASRRHHYIVNPSHGGYTTTTENPCPVIIARQDKAPLYLLAVAEGVCHIPVYDDDCEVMVQIKQFMAVYWISDIKMRMLKVPELIKIQGFPEDYKLYGTQSDQKKFIGNSVVPQVVKAWCEAMAEAVTLSKAA